MGEKFTLEISWSAEDLENALRSNGFKPTRENIEVLKRAGLEKILIDNSIETGWEVIDYIIDSSKERLEKRD